MHTSLHSDIKLHITLPHPTHSKLHHTHTAFQSSLPCLMVSNHSTSLTRYSGHNHISHTASQHHIPLTCTTPSFHIAPHFTPHLTLHDITCSITPYGTFCIAPHSTSQPHYIRHNIPHLALQNISHHTKFHTTLWPHHAAM